VEGHEDTTGFKNKQTQNGIGGVHRVRPKKESGAAFLPMQRPPILGKASEKVPLPSSFPEAGYLDATQFRMVEEFSPTFLSPQVWTPINFRTIIPEGFSTVHQ
jgi:hypothetical protein